MAVDSYLELFTSLYGWYFSSIIWNVFVGTGLVFLPFLVTIIMVWREAHEMGEDAGGATWMVRKMEVELGAAIVVFGLCLMPSSITSLSNAKLYYTPTATVINPTPTTATAASPDSTLGRPEAFGDSVPSVAAVPPWWYTVMGLSAGVNGAVRAGINGGMRDFRHLEDLARIASVEDPRLRSQIQRFYSECYVHARSIYLRADAPSTEAVTAIGTYGQADVDWIGSHAFQNDPRLYPAIVAERDVPGFAFNSGRDADVDPAAVPPALGRPSCADWWQGLSGPGLRDQMVDSVGKTNGLWSKMSAVFSGMSPDQLKDEVARLALTKAKPSYISPELAIGDDRGNLDKFLHAPSDLLGVAGAGWEGIKASATMMPLITLLTMVQPLLLMAIYMFLPIVLVFSRYSLATMMQGGLAIFSVKFFSVMWYVARWLDDHLIAAMFPTSGALSEAITTGLDGSYKRMILNILLMFMYLGLPLIWTSMMAWVGFHMGQGITGMVNKAGDIGIRAGQTGAELGKKIATKGRG